MQSHVLAISKRNSKGKFSFILQLLGLNEEMSEIEAGTYLGGYRVQRFDH